MANKIRYEKIQQRQGKLSELPKLDSGEIGFTTDTGQVFIGSNASHLTYTRIKISPITNARSVVQSYLNSGAFSAYEVTEALVIEAEDEVVAVDIIEFLNNEHGSVIAILEENIEFVTSRNLTHYLSPADYNAVYTTQSSVNPTRTLLTKTLTSGDADVFLEYDIKQVFSLRVNYTLIQRNGWHRRSGTISVLADNSTQPNGDIFIGFDDDQLLMNAAIHPDFIRFDAERSNNKLIITFNQPETDTTTIFYRVERWNIASVVQGGLEPLPEPPPNQVLGVGVDDGGLGLYDGSVLGIDTGDNN